MSSTEVTAQAPTAGRHRRAPDTFHVPESYLLAQDLGTDAVEASFAPVGLEPCPWCSLAGHLTTVRVSGWPREDIVGGLTCTVCCQCCAAYVIDVARTQQAHGDDRDISVEFGVAREVSA